MSLKGIGENRHLLRGKINNLELMALSAYDLAVKNGYQGTEEEWLLSLQGGVYIDKTLSIDGVAADAKKTGEGIRDNANAIVEAKQSLANVHQAIDNHKADKNNPHDVTAAQVGLGNVDNTSDLDKPVSTAQAEAIAKAKEEMLKSANDAQTSANNAQTSADNAQTSADNAQAAADNAQATADEAKEAIGVHPGDKNNPHEVTTTQIGASTMELLWENASISSSFAGQTLSRDALGGKKWEAVLVECGAYTVTCVVGRAKEVQGWRSFMDYYNYAQPIRRTFALNEDGSLTIGLGYNKAVDGKQYNEDNTVFIPTRIFGIKEATE